ncbi:Indoleamine 2,3-dioxygenase [Triangularia verruculosa]|uniref:Indoleamine 2,3-dioxygenase n=1 Tax=Triangularia verruculosa TaxID=2587418 RepID=A0AAN7AQ92_9PEZI|nr:Indoleamine 2,3-dioxygenase [Triangularia verruculosa]
MSPCEPLPATKASPSEMPRGLLEDFGVTSNAFLPENQPLSRLPHPYYAPWEAIASSLSSHIQQQTLRREVDRLPVLSTDRLTSEPEWRRAYVVLGFLTHAYVWGGEVASEILPPSITVPLLSVSNHLSLPPVATYAAVNLWNFSSVSPTSDLTDLDALTALHTFTGTQDESWFYMVSVAMEAQGGPIIPVMLSSLSALQHHDLPTVTECLNEITSCIHKLGVLLDRMHDKCDPEVFYHQIRPFLAGSKNMGGAGLPKGVFYDEGGNGKGEWRQYRGGSNGQSSLIQLFDLVLGVEHIAQGNASPDSCSRERKMESFHREVRGYMPQLHRKFLQFVEEGYPGGLRKGVEDLLATPPTEGNDSRGKELREAFTTATKALAEFRNKHLQIVTRYIVIPSRKENKRKGNNLAMASSRLPENDQKTFVGELTGTGGTALLPFLKQSRDETFRAGDFSR